MANLGQKVAKGATWVTLGTLVGQSVHFVVGMVLARLLTPADYGTVALLSIFFAVAGSLASCGFGNALVQKKDAGDLEFNSVFYSSLAMSLIVYAILFFAAPYIARFYRTPVLCAVTRVSAIQFMLSAVNSIQSAEISRKLWFDKGFKIRLVTCLVSAVFGVWFAYLGWGVWALVWASLLTSVSGIVASWTIVAWRPKLMFSFTAVKGLFSYGWKLSLSGLIHNIYMNLYGFLVGRIYTPADLAYVNKGRHMPQLLMSTIDGTILRVSFPALARLQDDTVRFRDAMRRMLRCSTFLVFPLLAGLCLCARPIILLLYGSQWEPSIPYVMVACFSFSLLPFNSINTCAISARGRSDVFLLLEIIKKGTGLVLMLLSIRHGVMAFMMTMAFVASPFAVFVNTFANGRLMKYNLLMQLQDIAPAALLCAAMSAAVLGVQFAARPLLALLPGVHAAMALEIVISAIVGVVCYFGLARAFNLAALRDYMTMAQPILSKKAPQLARIVEWFAK